MGCYINADIPKEEWLKKNAKPIGRTAVLTHENYDDVLLVCLVDNFMFTAAAIAYKPEEKKYFVEEDGRPKTWFLVERSKLPEAVRIDLDQYQHKHAQKE
jgi:hypothetical protein